ncbi:ABC transporter permease [Spirochaeta dissipatitropha]
MGLFYYMYWQFNRNRLHVLLFFIVQTLISVGVIFGFSFLLPEIDTMTALYLTTGAPTVIMLTTGLTILSQMVAEDKTKGILEYMLSWPIGRWVYIVGDSIYWFCITLPGILLAFVIGSWYLDISITISVAGIMVLLFIGFTSMCIGYAMAALLPPKTTHLMSQILIFAVLLFSPINFPPERLPGWLAAVHRWLPLQHVADTMRAAFAPDYFTAELQSYVIVAVWALVAFLAALWSLRKRG